MSVIQGCVAPGASETPASNFHPLGAVDEAVQKFHEMANNSQYKEIYEQSSDFLRKSTTEQGWENLLHSIRVTAGTVKSTQRLKSNLKQDASGTYLDALYDTSYTSADVKEEFIYAIFADHVSLTGYHVFGQTN